MKTKGEKGSSEMKPPTIEVKSTNFVQNLTTKI